MTTESAYTFGDWVRNLIALVGMVVTGIPFIVKLGLAVVAVVLALWWATNDSRPAMTEDIREVMCAKLGVTLPYVGQQGTMVLTGAPMQVTVSRFYNEATWHYFDKSAETRNVFCHHILRARVFNDGEYVLLGIDVSEVKWE